MLKWVITISILAITLSILGFFVPTIVVNGQSEGPSENTEKLLKEMAVARAERENKLHYVQGFCDGFILGLAECSDPLDQYYPMGTSNKAVTAAFEKFYSDSRNSNIPIVWAYWAIKLELQEKDKKWMESFLSRLRKVSNTMRVSRNKHAEETEREQAKQRLLDTFSK